MPATSNWDCSAVVEATAPEDRSRDRRSIRAEARRRPGERPNPRQCSRLSRRPSRGWLCSESPSRRARKESWYVNAAAKDGNPAAEILGVIKPWLEDPRQRKVSHDVKQVIRAMRRIGIEATGFELDTNVATFLLTGGQRLETVDAVVLSRFQSELYAPESEWPRRRGLAGLDPDRLPQAAGARAIALTGLGDEIVKDLEQGNLLDLFRDVEMALVPVLARIEDHGMRLDASLLKEMSGLLQGELGELRKEIYLDAGHEFNIDSPKQLGDVLFDELGLPAARKTKTGYSTAKTILGQPSRRAPDRQPRAGIPGARETKKHLHRRASRPCEPANGPHTHHAQPDRRRDRSALIEKSQSSEHSRCVTSAGG